MKTLIIIGIILAVLSLYFIVNADKSIIIAKGSEILPAGTDLARVILNKIRDLSSQIKTGNISQILNGNPLVAPSAVTDKLIPQLVNEATNLIKQPLENKINELICPIRL